jgi:hypothetical protein
MLQIFERRILIIYAQLRKMVYDDQGIPMNFINYIVILQLKRELLLGYSIPNNSSTLMNAHATEEQCFQCSLCGKRCRLTTEEPLEAI